MIAFTDAELESLRTIAAPLPVELRSRYLQMLGLVGHDKHDAELARIARGIRDELLARDAHERFHAQLRKQESGDLRGWT